MLRRRIETPKSKIVWHVTASEPVVVDIDLTDPGSEAKATADLQDRGWLESSRDLLHGLRVRETPMDALPDDLIEALIKTKR